jgi:hypothetical protein
MFIISEMLKDARKEKNNSRAISRKKQELKASRELKTER